MLYWLFTFCASTKEAPVLLILCVSVNMINESAAQIFGKCLCCCFLAQRTSAAILKEIQIRMWVQGVFFIIARYLRVPCFGGVLGCYLVGLGFCAMIEQQKRLSFKDGGLLHLFSIKQFPCFRS